MFSFAQSSINTQTFFDLGLAKLEQPNSNTQTAKKPLRFSWIEEYQLRTESRDFKPEEQEYTLRVSPSSLKKRKSLKSLSRHLHQKPDFDQQDEACDGLSELYADWLALYLIQNNLQILENLNKVLSDQQKVYEKMLGALEVDLNKLVKLQTDKSDIAIAVNELQLEEAFIRKRHGLEEAVFDFADFVKVEDIEEMLEGGSLGVETLVDAEIAYEKELLVRELDLEIAEKGQILDFMQVRYRGPHDDMLNERMAVGLGFQLPNSGGQKLKMAELQLKQKELELEAKRKQEETENETIENEAELLMHLQSYEFYQKTKTKEREELQKMGTQIAQQQGFNPLLLLDIEERHVENQLESLKKQERILYDFLQYLEESSRMCGKEFVNYLVVSQN